MGALSVLSLPGLPEIGAGDDLGGLIARAAGRSGEPIEAGGVVVVAHKAVSKAEGAVVSLAQVEPSGRARALAAAQGRDPRLVQVVLDESAEVLRAERGVIISRTWHGFVCANAGVDQSNAPAPDTVVLLPRDPDASARQIRARLAELTGEVVGVVVSDSFGRPWRNGQCDVALGCAGLAPMADWRGRTDSAGRELAATWLAIADAAAAAADLARAKDSGEPVVLIRGLGAYVTLDDGPGAAAVRRPVAEDLFR